MTAMTVWSFIEEGIKLFEYQTPVLGPPWTIPFEFPVFQLTAAFIVKLGVSNIDLAGRIAALLYFYISAGFLYLICEKYLGTIPAVCILLFYLWSPFTILWSRNFMIDYASVAFSMGYFYYFSKWLDNGRKIIHFLLSIILAVFAYLIKVTTLPVVLIPMIYFGLKNIGSSLKKMNYQFRPYLKSNSSFLAGMILIFLIPIIPFLFWLRFADALKSASEFTGVLTSASLSDWNYGTWIQKLSIQEWAVIMQRIVLKIITLPCCFFLIVGPLFYSKGSVKGSGNFVAIFGAGILITIFIFFNLYWTHDYYLMAVSPSISIVAGFFCYLAVRRFLKNRFKLKKWFYLPLFLIVVSIVSTGDYLKWSYEVSYDDPWDQTLNLARIIRENTTVNDYVIVADAFNWTPQYLYYAQRKGFMLWQFEGDQSNHFFKKYNFTTVVHAKPHAKLFSNWKYKEKLAEYKKFKIVRVSDDPFD
jgi:4-amino-4-deoxy-L-arabinose transferase-like glycosyltransferase